MQQGQLYAIGANLFSEYRLQTVGNIIYPFFLLSDVMDIVSVGGHCDNVFISELELYELLKAADNEFSVKLFEYVTRRLNWCRRTLASEIDSCGHVAKDSADVLRTRSRLAELVYKKYKMATLQGSMHADEDRELSTLLSQMSI